MITNHVHVSNKAWDRATRRNACPCFMRRARARYWRLARLYFACGATLGLALGMFLGAMSVPR